MLTVPLDAARALLDPDAGIARARAILADPDDPDDNPARCALRIIHRVQPILDAAPPDEPLAARDLAVLRALLALVFRHGVQPALQARDYPTLSPLLLSLFATLFPRGVRAPPAQTLITTTVLQRHVPDLLGASIALAWLPKSPCDSLRPFVLRLLDFLPLPQIMSDLGAVLSSSPPPHVRKLCSSLLTKSLLRPGGVRALFAAVFGEQESPDGLQLERYERTAGILMAVPAGLKPEEYFAIIVPSLFELLSDDAPAAYRRAAAFSVSRMLDPGFSHRTRVASLMFPIIHKPILQDCQDPTAVLSILTILLLNTDPSPVLITQVLSPILPALYALGYYLDTTKGSDPVFKESVRGLLATWGRVVETQDGVNTLWAIIQSDRIYWEVGISGHIRQGVPKPIQPAFITPGNVSKGDEANVLNLYPDPAHFVQYIKSLDRTDVASELFVKLLEVYHSMDAEDADPSRVLLYLQTTVEMQSQLCDDSSPTNILRKPEHILSFIKHALGHHTTRSTPSTTRTRGLGLEDLRIVDDSEDFEDGDSDDEPVKLGGDQAESSMIGTAINLLLAILEANPDLSARNAPVLNDIFSLLEPFSTDASESIRGLAREARMVITARLASGSTSWPAPRKRVEEDPQEVYQKALTLLQDPILPVRAHGLLLLRQLVSSRPRDAAPKTDLALVPAILSIFMQSVQDDDSYIFLNAVQGLSAMVDAFGKDVLRGLLETYTRHLSASSVGTLSKPEVDGKVRVGEALGQVIRRYGDALGVYADTIVPPLMSVFRSSDVPTILRTSAVSLLTQCVKTSRVSVLAYVHDLAASMIDVLQVEMSAARSPPKEGDQTGERTATTTEALDANPTAIDSRLPPFRRAALHFWTCLLNALTQATYNGNMAEKLPPALVRRAKVTLGYIASTDEDGIARVMAREASEAVDQLHKATLGI